MVMMMLHNRQQDGSSAVGAYSGLVGGAPCHVSVRPARCSSVPLSRLWPCPHMDRGCARCWMKKSASRTDFKSGASLDIPTRQRLLIRRRELSVSVALNVKRTRDAAQVHRQTSPTRLPYGLPSFTVMACCCNASCDTIVDFVYVVSLLLYGLGRVSHGSWGQIGVQPDALRVLYIKGSFVHT